MATSSKSPVKKKSKVNAAGNYTKPTLRKRLFNPSRRVEKVASRGNGQQEKRRCWQKNTKQPVVDTNNKVTCDIKV
tara:strand:- start:1342 stop:1569 length:228 start_codon:yes stop_codon:yes gene_type:complete